MFKKILFLLLFNINSLYTKSHDISVIGGGYSGLTSAITLAQKGHNISIYEKNNFLGGRSYTKTIDNYEYSMGPSWYIMDNLYEDVFNYFNYSSNNFYELYKPNFSYSIFLNNNTLHIPNNYNVLYKNIINNYDQNNTLKQYFNDASLFENISYPILWSKQDDIYDLFNVFYRFDYNTLKQIFNIKLDNYISHID